MKRSQVKKKIIEAIEDCDSSTRDNVIAFLEKATISDLALVSDIHYLCGNTLAGWDVLQEILEGR